MGTAPSAPTGDLDLDEIQGNILAGFNKDYQAFIFVQFMDPARGRDWLTRITDDVATSREVRDFNALFKAVNLRRHNPRHTQFSDEDGVVKATWMNIAFTHSGLDAVGVSSADLDSFPDDFKEGMATRAEQIGDVDASAPEHWIEPLRSPDIHALLLIAADTADDRDHEVNRHLGHLPDFGVELVCIQDGAVRADQPGHEHFGFKDGISQPGIRGFTPPNNPADPNQGDPGQDLLWPGEFVLGYPTQPGPPTPAAAPPPAGTPASYPGPTPAPAPADPTAPGPPSASGPDWTENGSYLVFRRLRQDVKGFRDFVAAQATTENISADVMGAKFVGRYRSGAPLERTKDQPATLDTTQHDPSLDDPTTIPRCSMMPISTTLNTMVTQTAPSSHVPPTFVRPIRGMSRRPAAASRIRRRTGCCGAASHLVPPSRTARRPIVQMRLTRPSRMTAAYSFCATSTPLSGSLNWCSSSG